MQALKTNCTIRTFSITSGTRTRAAGTIISVQTTEKACPRQPWKFRIRGGLCHSRKMRRLEDSGLERVRISAMALKRHSLFSKIGDLLAVPFAPVRHCQIVY